MAGDNLLDPVLQFGTDQFEVVSFEETAAVIEVSLQSIALGSQPWGFGGFPLAADQKLAGLGDGAVVVVDLSGNWQHSKDPDRAGQQGEQAERDNSAK